MLIRITEREGATILAALRRWLSYPAAREADSIATKAGKYKPLDNGEIEAVCNRLSKTETKRKEGEHLPESTNGQDPGARIETSRAIAANQQHRTRRRQEA